MRAGVGVVVVVSMILYLYCVVVASVGEAVALGVENSLTFLLLVLVKLGT